MAGNEKKFVKKLEEKEKKAMKKMAEVDKKLAKEVLGDKPKTMIVA